TCLLRHVLAREAHRLFWAQVVVVHAAEDRESEDELRDAHRAAREPQIGLSFGGLHLGDDGDHLLVDVDLDGFARIELGAIPIEALDLHELSADFAVVGGAVADEEHLLPVGDVEGAAVSAEDGVEPPHLRVAVRVVDAQHLDGLFERPWAAAPAIAVLTARWWPRVGGDLAAFEVLLHAHQAELKSLGPLARLLQRDVAPDADGLEGTEAVFV